MVFKNSFCRLKMVAVSLITGVVITNGYTPVVAASDGLPSLSPSDHPDDPSESQPFSDERSDERQIPAPSDDSSPSSLLLENNFDGYSENYRLGVGDQIRVDVFNAEDYSGEFAVLSGGVLNLPLVGTVPVEGLTLEEASGAIAAQLNQYVRRPRVTLSLLAARPVQVAIAGQVNRPGAYSIPLEAGTDLPTVTQIIEMAGGITPSADIREITVQRSGSDAEISVDLWQLIRDGQIATDVALQDGDSIVIPTATALSPEESTTLATASFSPDEISVNVVGEVDQPGTIALPPNTPLNQAILAAGGFNNRASQGTVSLVRLNADGTVTQQEIAVNFANGISEDQNPVLRPYDTIIVDRNGLSRTTDVIGSIFSPLSGVFSLLRLLGDF